MPLPENAKIKITGPDWTAKAVILKENFNKKKILQTRNIFVDSVLHSNDDGFTLKPGTMRVLCFIEWVIIHPKNGAQYEWRARGTIPATESPEQIAEAKQDGRVALLLLSVDSDIENDKSTKVYQCLNGEIRLDKVMKAMANADNKLYQALNLEIPDDDPDSHEDGRWGISVHGSGVSLHSQFTLPWMASDVKLIAPLLLSPAITRDVNFPKTEYRLSIEHKRLRKYEKSFLILTWQRLSRFVNPRNPLMSGNTKQATPIMVTLEVADIKSVPNLYWQIKDWRIPLPQLFADGAEFNIIFSDQQLYDRQFPPSSIASINQHEISIEGGVDNGLDIRMEIGNRLIHDKEFTEVNYQWRKGDVLASESVDFSSSEMAFSPVEIPQALRAYQHQASPVWSSGDEAEPLESPVLWSFIPLDNGWFQAPILNLTEQIMIDGGVADIDVINRAPEDGQSIMQGAITFGNTHEASLKEKPEQNPWNLTIIESAYIEAHWHLEADEGFTLKIADVGISMQATQLATNGLLWLSTLAPTEDDALPDMSDWINGLESIPLYSHRPQLDLFPAPMYLKMSAMSVSIQENKPERPIPQLHNWNLEFVSQVDIIEQLVNERIIPLDTFSRLRPLMWLRHRHLPMIQALPLTQTKLPPNVPSASRQLVPFEAGIKDVMLPSGHVMGLPDNWHFGVTDNSGANQWLESLSKIAFTPAREWVAYADLPLVSLSLPGLLLDPLMTSALERDKSLQLPVQFRYDLPYSDQIHALAELPDPERDPQLSSPLPDDPPEEKPEPLSRADYAGFWRERSIKASLAQVTAAELFTRNSDSRVIEHLLEPYIWEVQADIVLDEYPGSLQLDNKSGASNLLMLQGEDALEGISGAFSVDANGILSRVDPGTASAIEIVAGSASAFRQDLSNNGNGSSIAYRDQRGLKRGATRTTNTLLRTPVEFEDERNGKIKAYHLATLFSSTTLTAIDKDWLFWFKDLPLALPSATFKRSDTQSPKAQDSNDPEALSRQYNYLNGYEWRLGDGTTSNLTICGLEFYPLSLEELVINEDSLQSVKIIGRLQLPLDKSNPFELTELSNSVQLTFSVNTPGQAPTLTAMELASEIGEWPLSLKDKETTDAPLLTWSSIAYENDIVTISGVELHFYLFDVLWVVFVDNLSFGIVAEKFVRDYPLHHNEKAPIVPTQIRLTLDMLDYQHNTDIDLFVQLGERSIDELLEPLAFDPAMLLRYRFTKGGDPTLIMDDGILEHNFHLQVENHNAVEWLDDGGLVIKNDTRIQSVQSTVGIVDSLKQSNEVSVVLWVTPAGFNINPDGTIFAFAEHQNKLNFNIQQEYDELEFTILTDGRGQRRRHKIKTEDGVLSEFKNKELLQIVFTMRGNDEAIVYVNGKQVKTAPIKGSFSDWIDYPLGLANNEHKMRPWRGTYHYVALFNRVLDPVEIETQYDFITNPHTVSAKLHPAFSTTVNVTLLRKDDTIKASGGIYLATGDANVFDDIPLASTTLNVLHTNNAFEFDWEDYDSSETPNLQMFPGIHLNSPSPGEAVLPGFAICAFDVHSNLLITDIDVPQDDSVLLPFIRSVLAKENISISESARLTATNSSDWLLADEHQLYRIHITEHEIKVKLSIPVFDLQAAYVEILLHCRWGQGLQAEKLIDNEGNKIYPSHEDVFRSSSGNLTCNYSSRWINSESNWEDIYLLNGMLEVTNLVSWALDTVIIDNPEPQLQIPAITESQRFAPHTRHTIRVLFNQHEIDTTIPIVAEEVDLIFKFQNRHKWQFLAVTEHQLVDVMENAADNTLITGNYRRWTALQEVRLLRPDDFQQWLLHLNYSDIDKDDWVKTYNYLQADLRDTLANHNTGLLGNFPAPTLIVEASAPHWIRRTSRESIKGKTDIQYLPGGTQTAILSVEDDYVPTSMKDPGWLLLTMPFLGRLQDARHDLTGADDIVPANVHPLRVDPILQLFHQGIDAQAIAYILSNFAREKALNFEVSAFDTKAGLTWARLDPLSLEENWLRLQRVPPEKEADGIRGVMFALPDTPARISRQKALRTSFDSFRRINIATSGDDNLPEIPIPTGEIIWRDGQVFVVQGAIATDNAVPLAYAWHLVNLQLNLPGEDNSNSIQRYPASTLMPVPYEKRDDGSLPVSFAVSPYLGLGFLPANELSPRYIFAELLSLNLESRRMQVTATQFYDLEVYSKLKQEESGGTSTEPDFEALSDSILNEEAVAWARESHNNLAPGSPVAVLRFRIIKRDLDQADDNAQDAVLNTTYSFTIVDDIASALKLTRRMFRLRSDVSQLRYRQGQFGGYQIPEITAHPFELAPPQVNGVQSIYQKKRPSAGDGSVENEREWDWGESSMRVNVQYTEEKKSVISKSDDMRLWWQAPHYQVQFRADEDEADAGTARPTAGLPPAFRASSIRSLLPVLPDAPMPAISAHLLKNEGGQIMSEWQAILPGNLHYFLVGSRAGAIVAIRNKLLRQSGFDSENGSETLNSGSIPVQHRLPRPVPLPDNIKPDKSLQTWASRFETNKNALVTKTPADEAFFAETETTPMRRVKIILHEPYSGMIPQDWDGKIELSIEIEIDSLALALSPQSLSGRLSLDLLNDSSVTAYEPVLSDLTLESIPLPSDDFAGELPDKNNPLGTLKNLVGILQNSNINVADDTQVVRLENDINNVPSWHFDDVDGVSYFIHEVSKISVDNDPIVKYLHVYHAGNSFRLHYQLTEELDTFSRFASGTDSETLAVRAYILYEENDFNNYKQVLMLPLRSSNPGRLRLPMQPRFVHFEDPEYNRHLASLAGTASREIPVYRLINGIVDVGLLYTAKLSSDRREYNPNNIIFFRYDWSAGIHFPTEGDNENEISEQPQAQVELRRIGVNGAEEDLEIDFTIKIGKMSQVNLNDLRDENGNLQLQAGDVLEIRLYISGDVDNVIIEEQKSSVRFIEQVIILKLPIVAESVTPVAEAAYALLHAQTINDEVQVECVYFAWSPVATRIDLINPDDLLQETVRRRAVFQWQTSIRPERKSKLAIQKITVTGSTHFPEFGG